MAGYFVSVHGNGAQSLYLFPAAVTAKKLQSETPVAFQAQKRQGEKKMDKLKTNKEKHIVMDAANLSLSFCRN